MSLKSLHIVVITIVSFTIAVSHSILFHLHAKMLGNFMGIFANVLIGISIISIFVSFSFGNFALEVESILLFVVLSLFWYLCNIRKVDEVVSSSLKVTTDLIKENLVLSMVHNIVSYF